MLSYLCPTFPSLLFRPMVRVEFHPERYPSAPRPRRPATRAVGWHSVDGVITTGRLEDFFDYSVPFHCVAFNLRGAPTVPQSKLH